MKFLLTNTLIQILMKLKKIKEKFVVCSGCHKMSTINYTKEEITKIITCVLCGKMNTYKLKNK